MKNEELIDCGKGLGGVGGLILILTFLFWQKEITSEGLHSPFGVFLSLVGLALFLSGFGLVYFGVDGRNREL